MAFLKKKHHVVLKKANLIKIQGSKILNLNNMQYQKGRVYALSLFLTYPTIEYSLTC